MVRVSKSLPPAGIPNIEKQRDGVLDKLKEAEEFDLEVVYIDELVFSKSTMKRAEWSACKQHLAVDHDSLFTGFRTVIAAVSAASGFIYYECAEQTTDSVRYRQFVRGLSEQMEGRPFALYMDQLSVHRSKAAMDLYDDLTILPIFNVSYSPELNPIESCFSQVKRKFKSQRLWALINGQEFDMDEEIDDAFEVITPGMVANCAKRSYKLLKDLKK